MVSVRSNVAAQAMSSGLRANACERISAAQTAMMPAAAIAKSCVGRRRRVAARVIAAILEREGLAVARDLDPRAGADDGHAARPAHARLAPTLPHHRGVLVDADAGKAVPADGMEQPRQALP